MTGYTMHGGGGGFETAAEESIVDRSSVFDGVLRTSRNLRVEGQAKGEIHCEGTLYIDEGAEVNARIMAANIAVAGTLSGEVTCRGKLQIMPSGRVSGRVATASLIIQEGAVYEGELRMSNVGEEPAENPAPTTQVTTVQEPAQPSAQPYRINNRRAGGRDNRREEEQRADAATVPGEPERTPDGH